MIIWGSTAQALLCLASLFITRHPHIVLYASPLRSVCIFPIVGIISLFRTRPNVANSITAPTTGNFFEVQQFTGKCASAVANGCTGRDRVAGFINPVEEIRNGVTVLITRVQPDIVLALSRFHVFHRSAGPHRCLRH